MSSGHEVGGRLVVVHDRRAGHRAGHGGHPDEQPQLGAPGALRTEHPDRADEQPAGQEHHAQQAGDGNRLAE
ncbi:hypothetical protein [Dactylosporangium darangshiense]|uniref:hypothetical protein n=1 Tax=Dactylosporangium darangshiense TaxID=579108 RepID=UPI00362E9C6E